MLDTLAIPLQPPRSCVSPPVTLSTASCAKLLLKVQDVWIAGAPQFWKVLTNLVAIGKCRPPSHLKKKKTALEFMCSFKKKKKSVALPAVWFSSLQLFHASRWNGAPGPNPIRLAAGGTEPRRERRGPKHLKFRSPLTLCILHAPPRHCSARPPAVPVCRLRRRCPARSKVARFLIQTATPTLMGT